MFKKFIDLFFASHRCSTVAEAKRYSNARRNLLLVFCALAVFLVPGMVIGSGGLSTAFTVIGLVGIVCAAISTLFFINAYNEYTRLKCVLCDKCGTMFSLGNVSYQMINEKSSTNSFNDKGIAKYRVVQRYEFSCSCTNCGETKTFEYSFDTERGEIDRLGRKVDCKIFDVEEQIKSFFE